ncbi:FHA domain-containing protein [Mycobacterium terramassiliense]|uniref:FHA domain-containing protein n=1 Tax=Mycobacterium terramassiliense TaxID=1841859 RepID=UPI00097D816C|nr:FHA domain-containing protein [Mycobacterium terramassiliense]
MSTPAPEESTADIGPALRANLRDEFDTSAAVADAAVEDMATMGRGSGMLIVKRGPNAGSQFPLRQPIMSAGRHPGSDIFLDDITVSRRHAEFRRENGQFRVVDLGSLNSTYLNREAVDSAVLANGDEIQIGNFRLVFLIGPATG